MVSKKTLIPLWERVTFVYRFYDPAGALIYVGITDNVENRLKLHRKNRVRWRYIWHITVEEHPDRHAAFAAESWDIKHLRPVMNLEPQHAHVPKVRPRPLVSYSRRVRHYTFNGDEIESEVLGENPIHQT